MNDLISRSALMEYCSNQKSKSIDNNDIARFPSAEAVQVVRCKDCIYKEVDEDDEGKYFYCGLWSMPAAQWTVKDTDFCSKGERRQK